MVVETKRPIEEPQEAVRSYAHLEQAVSISTRQLSQRLDAIQTSAAWQLARPLRAAESRMPRLVRGVAAIPKLVWWTLTLRLRQRLRLGELARELLATGLFDRDWYIENNPDIVIQGQNPVLHWLAVGWTEGRNPNPLFDVHWYLTQYPQVARSGLNPLAHYLSDGINEGCDPNPLFDSDWYLERNPDVAASGANPLVHYLARGAAEGRDPSPRFDSDWYLSKNPDVVAAGVNPLVHYFLVGAAEGRSACPPNLVTAAPSAFSDLYRQMLGNASHQPGGADYVRDSEIDLDPNSIPVRVIAFFLPQFHPIPENDAWWGKGFTEWTNVTKAVPQFEGHYQPRLPDALGFYDLRLKDVQREQIRLAKSYGVYGFCYHYYWFKGKRLLERPFEQLLGDASLDFPFCLCWANENWTRRWDGQDQEVLIAQDHSPEDDLAFIADIEPAFRDPRYIRIEGRPLLIVYRAPLLANPQATAETWRRYCRDQGLPEVFLVSAQSFGHEDPREVGFDAAVEFPPHNNSGAYATGIQYFNSGFRGRAFDFNSLVAHAESRYQADCPYDLFPTVMPGWDNEARRPGNGSIFFGASPRSYGRWLAAACNRALKNAPADRRLVFVNAWNEWAEGAYLEPDRRYGFAYLRATAEVLSSLPKRSLPLENGRASRPYPWRLSVHRVLLVGHDAFPAGSQLLFLHLARYLKQRAGLEVVIWLLEGGDLLSDYQAVAEVTLLGRRAEGAAKGARELRSRGFDCAITNTVVTGQIVPSLREAGFHVVSLIHEMPKMMQERGLESEAVAIEQGANRVVFAAELVRRAFTTMVGLPEDRAVVLAQGIYQNLDAPPQARAQVEAELGLAADTFLVVSAGHGDRNKGFDIFLDCAQYLSSEDPRYHFLWVGNLAPDFQELYEQECRQGYPFTHLHQIPYTNELGRYFAAANLFLLTSREDSFPSVVLEALACGLPVVAFAGSGGHCELLGNPLNGRLASPLGDITALADSVRVVAAEETVHNERRIARAEAAKKRFDFAAYTSELLRLFAPELPRVSVVIPSDKRAVPQRVHDR